MVISDMLYILQHFNLNFIPFFIVNTVVFYNYCPTSPSLLLWKLWNSVKGNDWQIKIEYVSFFLNITMFLVSIGNHLVV